MSAVSVNNRLGAVHLYALETYHTQMEGYEGERMESVKWYITHHDGQLCTVFHLHLKPRSGLRPARLVLCRHETAEIVNLEDRTFLGVQLGTAVLLETVQAALSSVVIDQYGSRDTVIVTWAARAASAVHMAITSVRVDDIQPWMDAFFGNWTHALELFQRNASAPYFNRWPLPHPLVRAEADGSTLTEYFNDDGEVVDWNRTTPYTGA